jgi:hypothetical protein
MTTKGLLIAVRLRFGCRGGSGEVILIAGSDETRFNEKPVLVDKWNFWLRRNLEVLNRSLNLESSPLLTQPVRISFIFSSEEGCV